MTLMQLFMTRGISWFVLSKYSSRLPPNSLGCPIICNLPMRLRRGGLSPVVFASPLLGMFCPLHAGGQSEAPASIVLRM